MHLGLLPIFALAAAAQSQYPVKHPAAHELSDAERQQVAGKVTELGKRVSLLREGKALDGVLDDVEVYYKAAQWMLRFPEEIYNKTYVAHVNTVLDVGIARAKELDLGKSSWTLAKGKRVGRAYRSRVDNSLQPYAVAVPASYDPSTPARLDVVLHGRGATLSEVSFLAQQESIKPEAIPADRIELHVFGRTNNVYRWSGETDVFEALDSVRSRYRIDEARIAMRGFSMGGAGAWHIGLHYPDRWRAFEAGAGFNETRNYAKESNPPDYVERTWRIYDAVEYARNVFNIPTVGYGGEDDAQLKASLNIQAKLREEGVGGLRALFLVGPKTGHRWHPDSKRESDAFLDGHVNAPMREPERISFVTYTTRYNRCFWLTVDGLERHYDRAQVDGERTGRSAKLTTKNVRRLTIRGADSAEIDGQPVRGTSFEKREGKWRAASGIVTGKRHGLQGPIDDAFMEAFAIVKPTGEAWSAESGRASEARRTRFEGEYAKWLRADPVVVDDKDVNAAMARSKNLVLFGDPGSNAVIKRIAAKLPVKWTASKIVVDGKGYPAAGHVLVLICPNPEAPERYVVINSGHTFGVTEFQGTNALLFPRLGDYAVLDAAGNVVTAGLFGDDWRFGTRAE
jgi:pimeloyl-ACP methyl ester carboxylesterase